MGDGLVFKVIRLKLLSYYHGNGDILYSDCLSVCLYVNMRVKFVNVCYHLLEAISPNLKL